MPRLGPTIKRPRIVRRKKAHKIGEILRRHANLPREQKFSHLRFLNNPQNRFKRPTPLNVAMSGRRILLDTRVLTNPLTGERESLRPSDIIYRLKTGERAPDLQKALRMLDDASLDDQPGGRPLKKRGRTKRKR